MMQLGNRFWFFATLLLACLASLLFFDRPIADFLREYSRLWLIDTALIWATEAFLPISVISIAIYALKRMRHSSISRTLSGFAIAGSTALAAFILNEFALKPIIGRHGPWDYFYHHEYGFEPLHGSHLWSSFPSGHTVLAAAFLSVVWARYRQSRIAIPIFLSAITLQQLAGGWHFLSDILAGILVGAIAAAVALYTAEQQEKANTSWERR